MSFWGDFICIDNHIEISIFENRESLRYFCKECGSYLYFYDPRKKDKVYPFASAIDTPLPKVEPSEVQHIMYEDRCNWAPEARSNHIIKKGSVISNVEWHKKHGKYID